MIEFKTKDLDNLIAFWSTLDTKQKAEVRKATQRYTPRLKRLMALQSTHPVHQKILKTTRITSNAKGLNVRVGGSGRLGSWHMRDVVRQYEFGTNNRETYVEYLSRRKGTGFEVRRRTKRQMPARKRTGWMVYPAVAEAGPELASWWLGALYDPLRKRFG